MTNPTAGRGAGPRIPATVKWYDPAKGYGFLVPDDGSPDLFCRAQVLTAVSFATLLAGATITREVVGGQHGPKISPILTVGFSNAAHHPSWFARASGNGRTTAGSGAAASGRHAPALVESFHPDKAHGFQKPEDDSARLFCHLIAVCEAGYHTLPQGMRPTCMPLKSGGEPSC